MNGGNWRYSNTETDVRQILLAALLASEKDGKEGRVKEAMREMAREGVMRDIQELQGEGQHHLGFTIDDLEKEARSRKENANRSKWVPGNKESFAPTDTASSYSGNHGNGSIFAPANGSTCSQEDTVRPEWATRMKELLALADLAHSTAASIDPHESNFAPQRFRSLGCTG